MSKEQKKAKPFPIIISGVAGSVKSSVVAKLKEYEDKFAFSVSYTTRKPRPGESDGVDYHFISAEEFDNGVRNNEFLEWEGVHTDKYGTKRADFEQIMHDGKNPVMTIDVKGAENIKKIYKNALLIFITPPTLEEALRRLQTRGAETTEEIAVRVSRYNLEMSYKDKYDYIIVNDVLAEAKSKMLSIIISEMTRRQSGHLSKTTKAILISVISLVFLGAGLAQAYLYQQNLLLNRNLAQKENIISDEISIDTTGSTVIESGTAAVATGASVVTPVKPKVAAPTPAAKKAIVKAPPKHETPAAAPIIESTKTNTDGTVTTVVATAECSTPADTDTLMAISSTPINTPYDIAYSDETGLYPDLQKNLIDYLSSALKWGSDLSGMKKIIVRNAGAAGCSGLYMGRYTVSADGTNIISAFGMIILNTYYYKDSSYFSDYMKLVLSHEYGHHYTLYHKWVDWDLTISDRFPDSYYTARPLSKSTTATDYSLGWEDCEAEIIAEDYSYFYSGYGLHGMKDTYGYPSSATKNWLASIGSTSLLNADLSPAIDTESPVVRVTSPTGNPYTLVGDSVSIKVATTDNIIVKRIEAYINDVLKATYNTSGLSLDAGFVGYGTFNLKFKAYDEAGNFGEVSFVVIRNAPVVPVPTPIPVIDTTTGTSAAGGAALSGSVASGDVTSGDVSD